MTREEAIKELKGYEDGLDLEYAIPFDKAILYAIQALSKESISLNDINNALGASFRNGVRSARVKQEPCDDAVSRILKRMWNCRGKHTTSIDKVAMEQIIRDELPSVTQKSESVIEFADRCRECGARYGKYRKEAKRWKNKWLKSQKSGKWIEHPEIETSVPKYLMFYECSECGDKQCFCKSDIHKKRFCPNCGAKMESEE